MVKTSVLSKLRVRKQNANTPAFSHLQQEEIENMASTAAQWKSFNHMNSKF